MGPVTSIILLSTGTVPQYCMAMKVGNYFEKLKLSLGELPQSGPVFYGINRENSGYVMLLMGQYYLSQIDKTVADFLGLDDASEYAGKALLNSTLSM